MARVSVTDQPVEGKDSGDQLGTGGYALTLAEFIRRCETPLTIGVQGEWGSGKTSLLNMIQEGLKEQGKTIQGGAHVRGDDLYKTIWVNTWEHSLLKSPEECLLSIIEEIIDEIATVDGSYNAAARAKSALTNLAKGGLRAAATLSMGVAGADLAKDLVQSGESANTVKQLRNSLENIVETVINRSQNKTERFVVFVDDLDRLDPERAVEVLELLKNIFTIKGCVFVLAIDYQVIVKGLRGKFGEQNEHNEYEFRAFFDKIIQLPFMMPMAQYDLDQYINHLLVDEVRFFEKSQRSLLKGGTLARAVRLTLGTNPRSMKRLLNSLSLLQLTEATKAKLAKDKSDTQSNPVELSDVFLRQIVFVLVCCQISYPKIFELLLRRPLFTEWDDDFVKKSTGGLHYENMEVETALQRALEVNQGDFDEPWEEALFKIIWLKKWQRNRLIETSRLLSLICDEIVPNLKDNPEELEKYMTSALKITAVTAVSSTEEGIFASEGSGDDVQEIHDRVDFWKRFSAVMRGTGSAFDPEINPISGVYKAPGLTRRIDLPNGRVLIMQVAANSTSPLAILGFKKSDAGSQLYEALYQNRQKIESCSPTGTLWNRDGARPSIVFQAPATIKKRLVLSRKENAEAADAIFSWLAEVLQPLEAKVIEVAGAADI